MQILNKNMKNFNELVNNNNKFVIVCHVNPDADTIGSALAIDRILSRTKQTIVVCQDVVPEFLKFIDRNNRVRELRNLTSDERKFISDSTVAIAVDFHTESMAGDCAEIFKDKISIAIDHHKESGAKLCQNNIIWQVDSCASVMFHIIENMNTDLNKDVAFYLFCGIVGDTGWLSYNTVNSLTFERAAKLTSYGLDVAKIKSNFNRPVSVGKFKLDAIVYKNTLLSSGGTLAASYVSYNDFVETGADVSDRKGVPNRLLNIEGVDKVIVVFENDDGTSNVEFRSKGDYDCCKIALKLGGGGHKNAAGCVIQGGYMKAFDIIERSFDE